MNNKTKLIMTLLVRDEENIIESNICFHLNTGVDFIVAVDNGSVDKTPQILEKYQKMGVRTYKIIKKHTFEQSLWVSQMAKDATTKYGATHLFHCDADEFWYSNSGNLKDHLPKKNEIYYISLVNYLPPSIKNQKFSFNNFKYLVDKPINYPETNKQKSFELLFYKYPKKILTPSSFNEITMGNHDVISKKEFLKVNLEDEILIHHFPIRNLKHFKAKVINGTEAYLKNPQVDKNSCWHWRAWYKLYNENKLEDEYKKISLEYNNKNYTHLTKKTRVPIKIKNAKLIFNFKKILS